SISQYQCRSGHPAVTSFGSPRDRRNARFVGSELASGSRSCLVGEVFQLVSVEVHVRSNPYHLLVPQHERVVNIVNSFENETQVLQVSRGSQMLDAPADEAIACLGVSPSIQYLDGSLVLGCVTGARQQRGDPRAADLILLAKLS